MSLSDLSEIVVLLLGAFGFGLAVGLKAQVTVLFFKRST